MEKNLPQRLKRTYLEMVLQKGMVRSVDVARHMGLKPSVCHAVVTLEKGRFLTMDEDLFLRLTDIGREVQNRKSTASSPIC